MIGFGEAIKSFYAQYANFSGRATRAEYWWAILYQYLLMIVPYCFVYIPMASGDDPSMFWTCILVIIVLVNFIPSLAITWRRLHDTGRSGAWYFISLIPLVGSIVLLVFLLQASQPYPNAYGYPEGDYNNFNNGNNNGNYPPRY